MCHARSCNQCHKQELRGQNTSSKRRSSEPAEHDCVSDRESHKRQLRADQGQSQAQCRGYVTAPTWINLRGYELGHIDGLS